MYGLNVWIKAPTKCKNVNEWCKTEQFMSLFGWTHPIWVKHLPRSTHSELLNPGSRMFFCFHTVAFIKVSVLYHHYFRPGTSPHQCNTFTAKKCSRITESKCLCKSELCYWSVFRSRFRCGSGALVKGKQQTSRQDVYESADETASEG